MQVVIDFRSTLNHYGQKNAIDFTPLVRSASAMRLLEFLRFKRHSQVDLVRGARSAGFALATNELSQLLSGARPITDRKRATLIAGLLNLADVTQDDIDSIEELKPRPAQQRSKGAHDGAHQR
jgi:hypothetical protein